MVANVEQVAVADVFVVVKALLESNGGDGFAPDVELHHFHFEMIIAHDLGFAGVDQVVGLKDG